METCSLELKALNGEAKLDQLVPVPFRLMRKLWLTAKKNNTKLVFNFSTTSLQGGTA
jgi:hypothetical protein